MTHEILIVEPDTAPKHVHTDVLPKLGTEKYAAHRPGTLARCTCGTWFVVEVSFTWPTRYLAWYHIAWWHRKNKRRIRDIEQAERTEALRKRFLGHWLPPEDGLVGSIKAGVVTMSPEGFHSKTPGGQEFFIPADGSPAQWTP